MSTPNQELLSEITRTAIIPEFVWQIQRGDHDFQLFEILVETKEPRIALAALARVLVLVMSRNGL